MLVKAGEPVGMEMKKSWSVEEGYLEGQGLNDYLFSKYGIGAGDFRIKARLRLKEQTGSAATFILGGNHFGFEGASKTIFLNGPLFEGVKFLGNPDEFIERDGWFDFEVVAEGGKIGFYLNEKLVIERDYHGEGFTSIGFNPWRSTMQIENAWVDGKLVKREPPMPRGYTIPTIDLAHQKHRQVVVDREKGQYLGHPTTVLLEDGKTILCVYPKGHGRGAIVYKRSTDGGLTWSERLDTPENWKTSKEVPTIHRVVDAQGKKRLIMWSGLYPARLAVSEDDGKTWSPLKKVGDWGGIVVMGFVEKLKEPGHYLAMFHDDGRFFQEKPMRKNPAVMTLLQTFSKDGGLTWSEPEKIYANHRIHLCEPGVIRSPDGKQMAVLLRENRRVRNSYVIFSDDEGKTWSQPRELPAALTGDRHTGKYLDDGRLFISFRDTTHESPTRGDWVAWVGTYEDILKGREGQYRVRLMDNTKGMDTTYPGVEVLPDQTIVTTTYGHWDKGEAPYIMCVRLKLSELDQMKPGVKTGNEKVKSGEGDNPTPEKINKP